VVVKQSIKARLGPKGRMPLRQKSTQEVKWTSVKGCVHSKAKKRITWERGVSIYVRRGQNEGATWQGHSFFIIAKLGVLR
jgi:hypothetical protein